jgi:hypothetical protein
MKNCYIGVVKGDEVVIYDPSPMTLEACSDAVWELNTSLNTTNFRIVGDLMVVRPPEHRASIFLQSEIVEIGLEKFSWNTGANGVEDVTVSGIVLRQHRYR